MGNVNVLAVFLGALAFFFVGSIWYTVLFGKAWRELNGITDEMVKAGPRPGQNPVWLIMGLAFLFELLISLTFGHLLARTNPTPHVVLMMAFGFGAMIMAPAIGINYLYQMKPGKLFAIDAGYMIVGMLAVGGVFILLG